MKQYSKLSSHDTGRKFVRLGVPLDPPTPPLVNINTYFSLGQNVGLGEGWAVFQKPKS